MHVLRKTVSLHRPATRTQTEQQALVWLFDLDNTLHDSSRAMFNAIDTAMTHAVQDAAGCDPQTANALRLRYWKRYGATVIGMVRHHGVNARAFLQRSHDFDIASLIHAEAGVARTLRHLPGRKILLTNAPESYARTVLDALNLLPLFDSLWTMDQMALQGRLRPKPSLSLMRQVLARSAVHSSQLVLVEDTLKNLRAAHQLGMQTVHFHHPGTPFSSAAKGKPPWVDMRITSLRQLMRARFLWRIPDSPDRAGTVPSATAC